MNISRKIPSSLTSRLDEDYFLLHPVLKEKDKKIIFSMKYEKNDVGILTANIFQIGVACQNWFKEERIG